MLLRPAWSEDVGELTAAIAHESVARMLARLPWPYDEADAHAFVAQRRNPHLPSLVVTVPGARGAIVGGVGLHDEAGEAHVGYWVTPPAWGCGIATEALRGMADLAKLCGHARLVARHAIDNPASGRVLRNAGFRPTGRTTCYSSPGRGGNPVAAPEYALDLSATGNHEAGQDRGDPAKPRGRMVPAAA
ncbi:N-acetyltransferase [Aurantiacibacter spongiae]|uniref:N-acetyltransferase n=1 Tax=Aurantiacibacter spongiae TaxID=2488860 RepID=A0A3N5CYC0_9SPHN|nr:N-acetyltransferase [Aurantiacibacter spongiae]